MKKHNLHLHTTYSDGTHSPEDLIQKLKKQKVELIGLTDHAFTKKCQCVTDFNEYLKLKDLGVLIGLEIDLSKRYGTDPFKLPFEKLNQFDYLLFEYIDTLEERWGEIYGRKISDLIAIRHKLKIPVGLAHNDLDWNYSRDEDKIAHILSNYDIFVELSDSEKCTMNYKRNSRKGRDYFEHFSQPLIDALKKYEVKFVAGTDSHRSQHLVPNKAYQFVTDNNLKWHELVL
ncbi:PHP domain-containing protein [archaeon]|jgi:histidinol phosphatase-like PHP family hydrolase|nr:PHP domain-containing protein [archaeon]MBT3451621.1 PHP domain-containing protein [archaeon]MBT6869642.1 PHP domain-containing protein [archaeon]MBT7192410.1 PHP domain-containing protein [archaeon]MBT7380211.1 PHP domain-containing protein [archaeon]